MIINIRSTGGSGKSTLVKRIMARYSARTPHYTDGRRRPFFNVCTHPKAGRLDLLVPGHYEVACGGCDTLKSPQQVYDIIREHGINMHRDVLFEGIIVGDDFKRAAALAEEFGDDFRVIVLSTPIDECLRSIGERRTAKGNDKPLDPTNTVNRDANLRKRMMPRLRAAGVRVEELSRDEAYDYLVAVLDLA
jgi:hypothetical protein